MGGGTFIKTNKPLPGAYINFVSVPKPKGAIGDRGIATMPLLLSWGQEGKVIELLSSDLADGKSLKKVGVTAVDEQSMLMRLCLSNCYKLLVYRIDKGGVKATATIGELTIAAKYTGIIGNSIRISVIKNSTKWDVVTFFKNNEEDKQTVSTLAELIPNDWVDFAGEGNLTANAGILLEGGTDGTVTTDNYTEYFNEMKVHDWQVMGIPTSDIKLPPMVTEYIKNLREKVGKKVQAAIYNYNTANYEGIVSSKQGYSTEFEKIGPTSFVAWVTGALAGKQVNETNCYQIINGATGIIGDLPEDELEVEIKNGWFLLGKRVDGKIVVLDDINTLTEFSDEKDKDFSDNFVIRLFDEIATTTRLQFELNRIGKTKNNAKGRDTLKAQLISNLQLLQDKEAIQNFVSDDIIVAPGDEMGDVIVTGYIQPTGHMKKLYGTFYKRMKEV